MTDQPNTKPLTEAKIQAWRQRFCEQTDPIEVFTADDLILAGKQHAPVLDDAIAMMRGALAEIAELRAVEARRTNAVAVAWAIREEAAKC